MHNKQSTPAPSDEDTTPYYPEPTEKWFFGVGRINKKEEK